MEQIEEIHAQEAQIFSTIYKVYPNTDIEQLSDDLDKIIQEHKTFEDIYSAAISGYLEIEHQRLQLSLLEYAFILVISAQEKLEYWPDKKLEYAYSSILYVVDLAKDPGSYSIRTQVARRKEIARLGGEMRNEKYTPTKEEALRLLYKKMPLTGWKNISQAVNGIKKETYDFIYKNRVNLIENNLPATLKKWIKNTPSLSAAFAETSARAAD